MEMNNEFESNLEKGLKVQEERHKKNREIILQLVKEGKLPQPRKLTRTERKALDAADVNLFKIGMDDKRTMLAAKEDLADWVMDNIYPDFDFSALDNNICLWFGNYIFGLVYNDDLSIKN